MFSNTQKDKCPANLEYYPSDGTKNEWCVIRMDFCGVSFTGDASNTHWKQQALEVDKDLDDEMKLRLKTFMLYHDGLRQLLEKPDEWYRETTAADILKAIAIVLPWYHQKIAKKQSGATLLVLVDECDDKPIRDVLFDFIGTNVSKAKEQVAKAFPNYTKFFSACKGSGSNSDLTMKTWVTGITPVGLRLISGFTYEDCVLTHLDLRSRMLKKCLKKQLQ